MAETFEALGAIVPLNKGPYSAAETYSHNHLVFYQNELYWHVGVEDTTGVAPDPAHADESVWRLSLSGTDVITAAAVKAGEASASADAAKTSEQEAVHAARTAELHSENASDYATRAETAATEAETSRQRAVAAASAAEGFKDAAELTARELQDETAQIEQNAADIASLRTDQNATATEVRDARENDEGTTYPDLKGNLTALWAWVRSMGTVVTDNPEYVWCVVDKDNAVLLGIQHGGNVHFGAGIPRQIQSLINQMDAATQAQISTMHTSWLYGRKVAIIGDSISTFNGAIYPGYPTFYPYYDVQTLEDTWWQRVLSASGATLDVNASYRGSCVTKFADRPSFYERAGKLSNPNTILIALGTNDSSSAIALGDYGFTLSFRFG